MSTKDQERAALAKIKAILDTLDDDSYVQAAFAGCIKLAEENIANNLDPRLASRLYRGQNEIVDMSQADDYCQNLYKRKHPELAMEGGAK